MDYQRLSIIVSIWLVIIAAIPMWWETTEVKRAPLPVDEIDYWAADHALDVTFNLEVELLMRPSGGARLQPGRIAEQVEADLRRTYATPPAGLVKNDRSRVRADVQLGFAVKGKELGHKESVTENPRVSKNGLYTVFIDCSAREQGVEVKDHRVAIIGVTGECTNEALSSYTVSVIGGLFAGEQLGFWGSVRGDKRADQDAMREVKFAPEFQLGFSLLNADPETLIVSWSIKEAIERYIAPFLDSLSVLHSFHVSSQVQHFTSLPITPEVWEVDGEQMHVLRPNMLPLFINSAEWNLASVVSASTPLNFVVYVPPASQSPLRLVTSAEEFLPTNAFLIPRWGGIVVSNPSREQYEHHFTVEELKPYMEIYIAQLRGILGVKEVKIAGFEREMPSFGINYAPSPVGITAWELDRLLRRATARNLAEAASTLKSLSNLIQSMENMVVLDHIQALVVSSLSLIGQTKDAIAAGDLELAAKHARTAFVKAESAFFDPTMVSLLYFPDEHKYAVYMPLFTPIAVPLVLALVKEIKIIAAYLKERRNLKAVKAKAD
ncbi:hypothetical protein HK101_008738 [Irineochytrium annulatum]|nr:hypothetical protein HK101_008738 [Irineochytrium annulatum]